MLLMVMVISFGNVPFLLLLRFVRALSFMISLGRIRLIGPGVCSGMAGFPCFLVPIGSTPWGADGSEAAGYMVETALGRYSSDLLCEMESL